MKQNRKQLWENIRAMGKWRYISLMGGLWAGLFIILTTLIGLWPDGGFIHFRSFLIKTVVSYLLGGFLFGFLMWIYGEYTYKRGIRTVD
jgi:uncharacterized membrane protein YedE/YeeE